MELYLHLSSDGSYVALSLSQVFFTIRRLTVRPGAKLKIEIICSPSLFTDGHKLEADRLQVHPHSASPRAMSSVHFLFFLFLSGQWGWESWRGSLKRETRLGWGAVWRERLEEGGDLSACLNMDKLHYFFQPSVQSSPFFPIIFRVNEVA